MNNNIKETTLNEELEKMRKFAETYAKRTNTFFCKDLGITSAVIEGLARNKIDTGSALCPCRHYDDKKAEAESTFWNCPCIPMRERKDCHCMLFLTEENDYSSENQSISFDELMENR